MCSKEYESLNTETEMGQGIARSFWREDPKNVNILKHNPCETELLDIVKRRNYQVENFKVKINIGEESYY